MPWTCAKFFKSRAFKFSSLSGLLSFGVGTAGSAALAMKLSGYCMAAVTNLINELGTNFTISEFDTVVHYQQYNVPITLTNITAQYPDSWLEVINSANDLPPYCFTIPFIIGMGFSAVAALTIASTIGMAMYLRDQPATFARIVPLQTPDETQAEEERRLLETN